MATLHKKMPAATLGCPPLGGAGASAVDPLVGGDLGTTAGRGGSTTFSSVRTGLGASAGG